jgi:hypothetical protein
MGSRTVSVKVIANAHLGKAHLTLCLLLFCVVAVAQGDGEGVDLLQWRLLCYPPLTGVKSRTSTAQP